MLKDEDDSPEIGLIPQSMTTAPGLIQDPRTISPLPIATTRMSAVLVCEYTKAIFTNVSRWCKFDTEDNLIMAESLKIFKKF